MCVGSCLLEPTRFYVCLTTGLSMDDNAPVPLGNDGAAILVPSWSWASVAGSSYNNRGEHQFRNEIGIRTASLVIVKDVGITDADGCVIPENFFVLGINAPAKRLPDS